MIIHNQSLLRWALIIFVLFSINVYAQPRTIIVADDSNNAISNLKVLINNKIILFTDSKGQIEYEKGINKLEINENDYYFKDNNITKDGLFKIRLKKNALIEEVIIIVKDTVINEYKPKIDNREFDCSLQNDNLAILTSFEIKKKCRVLNYSFYITSENKFNKAFNFVIYKKNDSNIEKVFFEKVENYNHHNNTYYFTSKKIILDSGLYLFGMTWIINEPKTTYSRKLYKEVEVYGQSIGGSLNKKSSTKNYFLKDNKLSPIANKVFQQLKLRQ